MITEQETKQNIYKQNKQPALTNQHAGDPTKQ